MEGLRQYIQLLPWPKISAPRCVIVAFPVWVDSSHNILPYWNQHSHYNHSVWNSCTWRYSTPSEILEFENQQYSMTHAYLLTAASGLVEENVVEMKLDYKWLQLWHPCGIFVQCIPSRLTILLRTYLCLINYWSSCVAERLNATTVCSKLNAVTR